MNTTRRRLGEILVAEKVISEEQLKLALAEAALWGSRVGEVLVSRGICLEEQILRALATQLHVDVAPLATTVMIPNRILNLIPAHFVRERMVLPLFLDVEANILEVACADPADQETLDELRFRTGHEIRALVAMASEIEESIGRFYGEPEDGVEAPLRTPRVPSDPGTVPGLPPDPLPSEPLPAQTLGPPTDLDEAGRLRVQVDQLSAQLARVYEVVREASAAHQVLLTMLDERGLLDGEQYSRQLRARLEKLRR